MMENTETRSASLDRDIANVGFFRKDSAVSSGIV